MNGYLLMSSRGEVYEYTLGELKELFGEDQTAAFLNGCKPCMVLDKSQQVGNGEVIFLDVRYACNFFFAANRFGDDEKINWLNIAENETRQERLAGRK